jgi:hypothetical protein
MDISTKDLFDQDQMLTFSNTQWHPQAVLQGTHPATGGPLLLAQQIFEQGVRQDLRKLSGIHCP